MMIVPLVSIDLTKLNPDDHTDGRIGEELALASGSFSEDIENLEKTIGEVAKIYPNISCSGAYLCLKSSLMELIKNAASSDVGAKKIDISMEIYHSEQDGNFVRFHVTDDGKPFPEKFQDGVYIPPEQSGKISPSSGDTTATIGGANLGLRDAQTVCSHEKNKGNLYIQTGRTETIDKQITFETILPKTSDPDEVYKISDLHRERYSKESSLNSGIGLNNASPRSGFAAKLAARLAASVGFGSPLSFDTNGSFESDVTQAAIAPHLSSSPKIATATAEHTADFLKELQESPDSVTSVPMSAAPPHQFLPTLLRASNQPSEKPQPSGSLPEIATSRQGTGVKRVDTPLLTQRKHNPTPNDNHLPPLEDSRRTNPSSQNNPAKR